MQNEAGCDEGFPPLHLQSVRWSAYKLWLWRLFGVFSAMCRRWDFWQLMSFQGFCRPTCHLWATVDVYSPWTNDFTSRSTNDGTEHCQVRIFTSSRGSTKLSHLFLTVMLYWCWRALSRIRLSTSYDSSILSDSTDFTRLSMNSAHTNTICTSRRFRTMVHCMWLDAVRTVALECDLLLSEWHRHVTSVSSDECLVARTTNRHVHNYN